MTPPTVQFIPAAGGYLQEITWTMIGSGSASIYSTGLDIIWSGKTTQLAWDAGKPRLWNGSEALGYGATGSGPYAFASASACRTWWNNYKVEVRFNGGSWESLGDPITGSAQVTYVNAEATTSQSGTAFVNGDVVDFRVSDAS